MSSQADTTTTEEPVIRCKSVYMIFGDNAKNMLDSANGVVDAEKFQEAGCIVGVNNASFEVYKGELLIIMGLSGSGKSTLMRLITGRHEPDDGELWIHPGTMITTVEQEPDLSVFETVLDYATSDGAEAWRGSTAQHHPSECDRGRCLVEIHDACRLKSLWQLCQRFLGAHAWQLPLRSQC